MLHCGSGEGVRDGEGELNISGDCCSGGTTTKLIHQILTLLAFSQYVSPTWISFLVSILIFE